MRLNDIIKTKKLKETRSVLHMVEGDFENIPMLISTESVKGESGTVVSIGTGIGISLPIGYSLILSHLFMVNELYLSVDKYGLIPLTYEIDHNRNIDDEIILKYKCTKDVVIPKDTVLCDAKIVKNFKASIININSVTPFDMDDTNHLFIPWDKSINSDIIELCINEFNFIKTNYAAVIDKCIPLIVKHDDTKDFDNMSGKVCDVNTNGIIISRMPTKMSHDLFTDISNPKFGIGYKVSCCYPIFSSFNEKKVITAYYGLRPRRLNE